MTVQQNELLLDNRYKLLELIGKGAMGRVYRSEDTLLGGVIVAIKFLSQAVLNQKTRALFEREATICALLGEKNIHIVRVKDYGVDAEEVPFYVMEFLEGKSLSDLIKNSPLCITTFFHYTRQICLGLRSAHAGIPYKGELWQIIHRDIKPSNILVVDDSSMGQLIKVLDFGIAKMIQPDSTQTNTFMGTMAYASPEQLEGEELDHRSDIYSLGVMMYEMLTGDLPLLPDNCSFGGWYKAHREDSPQPFAPQLQIPQPLQELIFKCISKDPRNRPQTVKEILTSLETIQLTQKTKLTQPKSASNPSLALALPSQASPQFKKTTFFNHHLAERLCIKRTWDKNKPQQEIVFPKLLRHNAIDLLPTLWVMLEAKKSRQLRSSSRYNRFLFLPAPHPMLLWITVVYNPLASPHWLPCYLDLKSAAGQTIARTLGKLSFYYLLFFSLDDSAPQKCEQITLLNIDPKQSQMLIEWADQSLAVPASQPSLSKEVLKRELEKLKPEITAKLDQVYVY